MNNSANGCDDFKLPPTTHELVSVESRALSPYASIKATPSEIVAAVFGKNAAVAAVAPSALVQYHQQSVAQYAMRLEQVLNGKQSSRQK